jgi:zinc protease
MKAAAFALLLAVHAAAQPSPVKLPPFIREVLPDGATLYLMPKADAPLLSLRVIVRGGAESDPPGLAGLSAVVVSLLGRGTTARTAGEFASAVDFLGAQLDTYVDAQSTTVALDVLPAHTEEAVGLLEDAIRHPAFREAEIQRQIRQSIETARTRKDSPEDAIWQYFDSFFFRPPHPYGRPFLGDELSLRRITRADVERQYRRLYVGRNVTVVAVGPFPGYRLRAVLARAFGGLPAGTRYQWLKPLSPGTQKSPRLLLVDKPDATQTQFVIGFPGIGRDNPDRIPLWLVNNILGGRFTSLLNERLRVKRGLTYGAYSEVEEDRMAGAITIYSYTATANTKRTIDLTLRILRTFAGRGITAQQLQTAKTYIEASYPSDNLQTSGELADLLGDMSLYGLGRNDVDRLFARMNRVTVAEANRVLRKYFYQKPPVLVLIGQAREVRAEFDGRYPRITEVSIDRPGFPRPAGILEADARSASSTGRRPFARRPVHYHRRRRPR